MDWQKARWLNLFCVIVDRSHVLKWKKNLLSAVVEEASNTSSNWRTFVTLDRHFWFSRPFLYVPNKWYMQILSVANQPLIYLRVEQTFLLSLKNNPVYIYFHLLTHHFFTQQTCWPSWPFFKISGSMFSRLWTYYGTLILFK